MASIRAVLLFALLSLSMTSCGSTGIPGGSNGSCDGGPAECGCQNDSQCGGATPRCDRNTGACVACLLLGTDCPAGQKCIERNGMLVCTATCASSADCGAAHESCCDGTCTDTASDTRSCGGCGTACPAPAHGVASCSAGTCKLGSCAAGFLDCDSSASTGCEVDGQSDVRSCGGCGKACAVGPHQTAACALGSCSQTCAAGFAHCSQDPADGCEVNINTDLASCGACGSRCAPPNASATCVGGRCSVGSCSPGFGDCNGAVPDGCEVSLVEDAANCGACGKSCAAIPNADSLCRGGACAIGLCKMGFADCDALPGNGCEISTASDDQNCGICGHVCMGPRSVQECAGGACTITSCTPGSADCDGNPVNGCEVPIGSDVANCGGCGKACPAVQNGVAGCANATCGIASCNFGFAHCSMSPMDGCEANLLSPQSCGRCGNVCAAPPNATPGCNAGNCGIGACSNLWGDCNQNAMDGCEKNLASDLSSCGKCGSVCAVANGTPACLGGQCGILGCNQGFADCDMKVANGCEIATSTDAGNCGKCGNACPMNQPFCVMGACSDKPAATVFTGAFQLGVTPIQQCNSWNVFRAALNMSYGQITMAGTNDQVGVTCAGNNANILCAALHNGGAVSVLCNGRQWRTGACGAGLELSADGSICQCASPGYVVRPCIGNLNWGGVNTATCSGPDQTITVSCQ